MGDPCPFGYATDGAVNPCILEAGHGAIHCSKAPGWLGGEVRWEHDDPHTIRVQHHVHRGTHEFDGQGASDAD